MSNRASVVCLPCRVATATANFFLGSKPKCLFSVLRKYILKTEKRVEVEIMYLDKLLGSKTKINLLSVLVSKPERSFIESELAKEAGASVSEVNRQISYTSG